jgi:hypothetical protein
MTLAVLDWRHRVHDLYRAIRFEPDPARAHRMWCEQRQQLMTEHPASPNQKAVLQVPSYDPQWRVEAEVKATDSLRLDIPTATDGIVPFERIGSVTLPQIGELDVWWLDSYGGGVWLPLADASPDSYSGGRYILDTVKGADLGGDFDPATGQGTLVVDLNFAYNPSCVYDEAWACPLAPPVNRTKIEVPVGEMIPR